MLPPAWNHPLSCAALAAVLLHGALAVGLMQRSTGTPGEVGAPAASPAAGMKIQLLSSPLPAATIALASDAGAPTLAAADAAPPIAPALQQDASEEVNLRGERGEAAELTYFGREDLDLAPKAQGIVQIAYPPGVPGNELQAGRLTLFIDEHGTVQRIQVLDQSLPPPFQEAARNAFLQARFAPGERAGRNVRSRIDVEVVFDARQTRVVSKLPVHAESPT